jgi:hypothetical protein
MPTSLCRGWDSETIESWTIKIPTELILWRRGSTMDRPHRWSAFLLSTEFNLEVHV